ncbi:MAG TPA: formylmethanofuran dehydrogenase subunit E family protein [Terriglobia bacterium]|nr:formylmethanofuran dehydrogenase subunit E family protein [Terriglobia bacterium]
MKSLEEYLELAAKNHGHMCPGQVLGVRMAMRGLKELAIDDPAAHRRRLITYVEIDRCATDAVSLVTGCRLGKRSLKFMNYDGGHLGPSVAWAAEPIQEARALNDAQIKHLRRTQTSA